MKAKITIKGSRVQDVGYRLYLLSKAHKLQGFEAANVPEGLILLVEGEEDKVNQLIQTVKTEKPPLAEVNEVLVESYDGDIQNIREYREQLSLEQLAKIATVGVEMKDDIKEMKVDIKEMKGDIKEMKVDIKEMKSDIKEMKGDIKEMKDDIKEVKGDMKLIVEKQDQTISEIKALREDLKQYMDRRFEKLERDIALIKEKVGLP